MFDDSFEIAPYAFTAMMLGVTVYALANVLNNRTDRLTKAPVQNAEDDSSRHDVVFVFSAMGTLNHFMAMAMMAEPKRYQSKIDYQWVPCNPKMEAAITEKLKEFPPARHHVVSPDRLLEQRSDRAHHVIAGVPSDSHMMLQKIFIQKIFIRTQQRMYIFPWLAMSHSSRRHPRQSMRLTSERH